MRSPRTFVLCDSPEHAEIVDQLIMERLREVDGNQGSQWSGVYTDGTRYGVLWGAPASTLFGSPPSPENPNGDPSLVLAEEVIGVDGESDWGEYDPGPQGEEEEAP